MAKANYDIIVIGGSAAGLTAALFAVRRGWRVAIVSADIGGQMTLTDEINNYPGIVKISGKALARTMLTQAESAGVETFYDRVAMVEPEGDSFAVATAASSFTAKAVILAFGLSPRLLGVPGESTFVGRGISYGISHDLEKYRYQTVAVVGGGNGAVTAALQLAAVAHQVYLVHRRDTLRADQILADQLTANSNIEAIMSAEVVAAAGDNQLTEISIRDINGNRSLACNQLIVQIGFTSQTDWLGKIVKRDKYGMITIDGSCRTSQPGIFAAGDVTSIAFRQVIISAGEGAKAALSADQYLRGTEKQPIIPDWK